MTKEDFAKKILKCTHTHWYCVLKGDKNLGYRKAEVAARVLNTPVDLWINPDASVNDRKEAWDNFTDDKGGTDVKVTN